MHRPLLLVKSGIFLLVVFDVLRRPEGTGPLTKNLQTHLLSPLGRRRNCSSSVAVAPSMLRRSEHDRTEHSVGMPSLRGVACALWQNGCPFAVEGGKRSHCSH